MIMRKARPILLFVVLQTSVFAVWGKDLYVAPNGSDKNSGSSATSPLATIAAASNRAAPGDTVYLISGQYQESIVPVTSGTAAQPITYKSFGAGPAVISNVKVGIYVNSVAYITFDGISVNGTNPPPKATVNTFVAITNSNHIVVKNGNFQYANGWAGFDITGRYSPAGRYYDPTLLIGTTSYVTIQDNTIDNVGNYYAPPSADAIQVANGTIQHILIQRNKITHGVHDLIEFDCDYGVMQDNILNNSYSDLVSGDTGYRSIEVQGTYNVIQRNLMEHSRLASAHAGPITSIRGSENIVRLNIFFDGIREANVTWCDGHSGAVENGRIYNNTMDRLGSTAWSVRAYNGCPTIGGWVFANNLIVDSNMAPGAIAGTTEGPSPDGELFFAVLGDGGTPSIGRGPTAQSVAVGNLFAPYGGGPAHVVLQGAGGRMTLSAAAGQYPTLLPAGNVTARASFVSPNPAVPADFQLAPNSPGHGGGVFLTKAVGAGTSSRLPVQDSLYFSDGNGLVPGDLIQLQGATGTAQILSIDRTSNTLILSSPVTFTDGQGVALPYSGSAPDVGAGLITSSGLRPMPPAEVRIGH